MKVLMVIPAYNEELVIENSLRQSVAAFDGLLRDYDWMILVADNGSVDRTCEIVRSVACDHSRVGLFPLQQKGKGLAIREAWKSRDADVYAFMDADLATDLRDVPALIDGATRRGVAAGSRFHRDSVVRRSLSRRIVSRVYRLIARVLVSISAQDLQCGFKAVRRDAAQVLFPLWTHEGFFFDTEILAHAERCGFVVANIPVRWEEGRDARRKTSVKIFATAWDNFKHLWILRRKLRDARKM
ncbi:MAG: glycosyltransferase [Candidatus Uhrbacteria bacterium]